jgi:hypothetical protein
VLKLDRAAKAETTNYNLQELPRYRSIESILKNSLDQQPLPSASAPPAPLPHDNIHGAEYFE